MRAKFIWQLVQEGRTDSDNKSRNKSECQLWLKYLSQYQKYFGTL